MSSSFPDYDDQDPEVRVIEEGIGQLHIMPPDEAQIEEDNTGITAETEFGDKLMPICRLVDDLVKCYEDGRCQHDEIVKRGETLEEIMLIHEDKLIRENEFLFLLKIGQLYSMIKNHKQSAIDALTVVVEHDPNAAEAWDALADCYWEMSKYDNAQICLANSLRKERRKVPLRNMSVVCRRLATKYPDRESSYLQTGISLAKEAVDQDIKDGISWGILGNAYLSAHFKLKKDMKCAKLALSAFKQAVNMGNTSTAALYFHQGYDSFYLRMRNYVLFYKKTVHEHSTAACGCMDANGEVFVITVYNLTGELFFVGDTIIIPTVDYKMVCFEYKDQYFEFRCLRVDKPIELLLNREGLRNDYFSQL